MRIDVVESSFVPPNDAHLRHHSCGTCGFPPVEMDLLHDRPRVSALAPRMIWTALRHAPCLSFQRSFSEPLFQSPCLLRRVVCLATATSNSLSRNYRAGRKMIPKALVTAPYPLVWSDMTPCIAYLFIRSLHTLLHGLKGEITGGILFE
jgi:hypothetical protein